jgi:DNA processing protein
MIAPRWPGTLEPFEIALADPLYPQLLAMAPDPPAVLRGFGDPTALAPGIAVVGARKATPYGTAAARIFAGWCGSVGYTVISGAAVGCDQAALRSAVERGGRTVAVLGSGADVAYPGGSDALLFEIARRGCVISELCWGHPPAKWTFRARNRIIAGLAAALLVLEADVPSGTFITADNALDAGREVMVVPGSIFAPECRGPNRLLRQGATPVCDVSELAGVLRDLLGAPPGDASAVDRDTAAMSVATQDPLLRALRANPMRPDDVARELGLDIITVMRRIGTHETKGALAKYPDGRYGPC